jgi:hypothetical protein
LPKVLCALAIYESLSGGRNYIVYCTNCGTNNADGATGCINCGASLYGASGEGKYVGYAREYGHRRSGAITGIVIGLIIIFAGFSLLVSELYGINMPWGPIIIILFGVFILVRLFQVRSRRR